MRCPNCKANLNWYRDALLRPAATTRKCPACGTSLELLNSGTPIIINSVIFAVASLYIWLKEIPYAPLWFFVLFVACWLTSPLWLRLFGRLVVRSYSAHQLAKVQRLAVEQTAATITVAGWTLYMVLTILLPYGRVLGHFDPSDDQSWQLVQNYAQTLRDRLYSLRGIIELAIGAASITWIRINLWRRSKLITKSLETRHP